MSSDDRVSCECDTKYIQSEDRSAFYHPLEQPLKTTGLFICSVLKFTVLRIKWNADDGQFSFSRWLKIT